MDDIINLDTNEPNLTIHIRVFQRRGKACVTIIEGLPKELNLDLINKTLKKSLCCGGNVMKEDHIIQLTGDQRTKVSEFLIKEGIAQKEDIHIHGF